MNIIDTVLKYNNTPLDEFEGFSPNDMRNLLYSPFDEKTSPMVINTEIDNKLIENVAFYKHIIQYLEILKEEEPLKLTQLGNLPRKLCRRLCALDFYEDESSKRYFEEFPLMKEEDSAYINMINVLTQLSGCTKIRYGKMTLTKKCKKYLDSKETSEFYIHILESFIKKFNWAFSDFYQEVQIIQDGFAFSIYLVQKYGDKKRELEFYCDKYLKAFPNLIKEFFGESYSNSKHLFQNCYHTRVYERFLKRFGLIEIENKEKFPLEKYFIIKMELLDQLIKWKKLEP